MVEISGYWFIILPSIVIDNCIFESGISCVGAGMYMYLERPLVSSDRVQSAWYSVLNSHFIGNREGGGAKIELWEISQLSMCYQDQHAMYSIKLENCTFTDILGWPSSAISIENRNSRFMPLYDNVLLRNISISNNIIPQKYENVYGLSSKWDPVTFVTIRSSTVYLYSVDVTTYTLKTVLLSGTILVEEEEDCL